MSVRKRSSRNSSKSSEILNEDDAPEITSEFLDNPDAVWRIGRNIVSPKIGRKAMHASLVGKTRVNMHIDRDVIAFFKAMAGDRGYQTLMNAALRRAMEESAQRPVKPTEPLEERMRRIAREEIVRHEGARAPRSNGVKYGQRG